MFDFKLIEDDSLDYKRKFVGSFSLDWFDQLVVKVKNPVIYADMKTIIYCLNHIQSKAKANNIDSLLMALIAEKNVTEVLKSFYIDKYRFDFKTNVYNMFGIEIPFIIIEEDTKRHIYVANSENENDYVVYHVM